MYVEKEKKQKVKGRRVGRKKLRQAMNARLRTMRETTTIAKEKGSVPANDA